MHDLVVEVASAGETYAMDVPQSVDGDTRVLGRAAAWSSQSTGTTVLGSAKMGPNRPAQGAHVGTASFVVAAAARGRGIGRALGEYAVEWHRANGFAGIQFNAVVSTNTGAIRLWQSLGFETIGIVPGAFRLPDSSYADLHVMYLRLEQTDEHRGDPPLPGQVDGWRVRSSRSTWTREAWWATAGSPSSTPRASSARARTPAGSVASTRSSSTARRWLTARRRSSGPRAPGWSATPSSTGS